ncbi:hypothetical protein, partial [Granulicella sp. S190]|uniref:hypothetical protein n=1 Tax=Granulicella sp. S190 TaxID=1747226 RepID=UPI001C2096DE
RRNRPGTVNPSPGKMNVGKSVAPYLDFEMWAFALRASRSPSTGATLGPAHRNENKLEKVGTLSASKKHVANNQPQPRKPPQLHHQNTTSKTRISAKHPVKTPNHHVRKIYPHKT